MKLAFILCGRRRPHSTAGFEKKSICSIAFFTRKMRFFLFKLLCADTQPHAQPLIDYQRICMQNAMAQKFSLQKEFQKFIVADSDSIGNVCEWRGVDCENDGNGHFRVTTVIMIRSSKHIWQVTIGWFPSSVRTLSLELIEVKDSLSSKHFPRDLEFARLYCCSFVDKKSKNKPLDLRYLPVNLEELHIIESWLSKTVIVDALPKNLKILRLGIQKLQRVILGEADAPKEWQFRMSIEKPNGQPPRVVCSASSTLRKRLFIKFLDYRSPRRDQCMQRSGAIYTETHHERERI